MSIIVLESHCLSVRSPNHGCAWIQFGAAMAGLGLSAVTTIGSYRYGVATNRWIGWEPVGVGGAPAPQEPIANGIGTLSRYGKSSDPTVRTFYRGDKVGETAFFSNKVSTSSLADADQLLLTGNWDQLMIQHKNSAQTPPSPFVSVTTDPGYAEVLAATYRTRITPGKVYIIRTNRAIFNPFGIEGENEWLLPLLIWPWEIVNP